MKIKDLNFVQTCSACPEQYDVFDTHGSQVGYVRLRWGRLTCEYPDCGGELIYDSSVGDGLSGCFEDDSQRDVMMDDIANAILRTIKKKNMRWVKCIQDFVEDATVYWCEGKYYHVVGRDNDRGGWRIKHEYGEGIIYDEDFDDYFEEVEEDE